MNSALYAWQELARFRQNRRIIKQFVYGGEPRADTSSLNVLRRLVRVLVGQFRADVASHPRYDAAKSPSAALNSLLELDARMFEEFIISGAAIQRIVAERRPGGSGVWVDNVNPDDFFVNRFSDSRGADIDLIGMFHRMKLPQLINRFGRNSSVRAARLREVFDANSEADFFEGSVPSMRVAEVWSLDPAVDKKNGFRYNLRWRCRHFAPDGAVLADYPSPFSHQGHPFAVKFYPFVDGEIHPFLEDLIGRQVSINRLLASFETTVANSAKGALLFPVDQLLRGLSLDTIGELWARHDSVIPIAGRGATLPQQMVMNPTTTGILDMIEMQLRLFDEASGINDALLGRALSSNMSTEMYRSVIATARIAVADLLDSFTAFLSTRDSLLPPN